MAAHTSPIHNCREWVCKKTEKHCSDKKFNPRETDPRIGTGAVLHVDSTISSHINPGCVLLLVQIEDQRLSRTALRREHCKCRATWAVGQQATHNAQPIDNL